MPDAEPVHAVAVDGFWIDTTPVTNAQFDAFVKATRYVTVAERKPDAKDYPGVPADKLVAGSACFKPPSEPVPLLTFIATDTPDTLLLKLSVTWTRIDGAMATPAVASVGCCVKVN